MKLTISLIIWLFWLVFAISGLIAVPILLAFGWEGYTGPWGNSLYGKYGNGTTLTRSNAYLFLAIRNPASNVGRHWFGVPATATWPWYVDNNWIRYGWAEKPDSRDGSRKFYFNPFRWTH
jgi:hypothetical protein